MQEGFKALDKTETEELVEDCYSKGSTTTFLKALREISEDPLEPLSPEGNYRLHPLIWTVVLSAIGGASIFLYFTFKS